MLTIFSFYSVVNCTECLLSWCRLPFNQSTLSHWSVCVVLMSALLINTASRCILKSGSIVPPPLFNLVKIALSEDIWRFNMHFRMSFSFLKYANQNFDGNCIELYIALQYECLSILFLPVNYSRISCNVLESYLIFHQYFIISLQRFLISSIKFIPSQCIILVIDLFYGISFYSIKYYCYLYIKFPFSTSVLFKDILFIIIVVGVPHLL